MSQTDHAGRRHGLDRGHDVLGGGAAGGETQEAEESAEQVGRDAAERVQVAVGAVERGCPDADRPRPQDRSSLHVDGALDVAREEPAHRDDAAQRGEQHRDGEQQDYELSES